MANYCFKNNNIEWRTLDGIDHLAYCILDVDRERKIADVLFKFEPHRPIVLHRHKVLNKTLVLWGEHRLYEPGGKLKEIRPAGNYTSSPANFEPHRECGGDEGAIVFFSIRDADGVLYEILDDSWNTVATLAMQDLADLFHSRNS